MDTVAVAVPVISALVGAGVGAHFSGQAALQLEQIRTVRDDTRRQAEVRGAARLVLTELVAAAALLDHVIRESAWMVMGSLPSEAWSTHGALLAAELPAEPYLIVASAGAKLTSARAMVGQLPPEALVSVSTDAPPEGLTDALETLRTELTAAVQELGPLAYQEWGSDAMGEDLSR